MTRWLVDGNNVMGSRPDRWWNDRPGAMARLAQEIAEWCWTHGDAVVLVFDGPVLATVDRLAGGNLRIEFAGRRASADDLLVQLAGEHEGSTDVVVTADRGLRARLTGIRSLGPQSFLDLVAGRTTDHRP